MRLTKVFIVLLFLALTALPVQADDKPPMIGIYNEVSGKAFSFDGKQVEIIEFLNFYCGNCNNFEKDIPVIKGNFPKKTKWKIVPLYWGKSAKAVEAFFLAEEAGKADAMKKALFKAVFIGKRDISNIDVLEKIGMDVGLGFDFSRRLRAGEKAKEVGEALLLAQEYDVSETPTLIIAGNMKVTPHDSGHAPGSLRNNVITIIKGLFKK